MSGDLSLREASSKCYLSKLTGKLIDEEQQLSASVMIGGGTHKATTDTGATASFISEELADIGRSAHIRNTQHNKKKLNAEPANLPQSQQNIGLGRADDPSGRIRGTGEGEESRCSEEQVP